MRVSFKKKSALLLSAAALATAALGLGTMKLGASAQSPYGEAYRNRLAYSAAQGWNNDPNGLLYVDGTWHMYYQYSYNAASGETYNYWKDVGWGHAESSDLVHWEEQPVAIPAYQTADGAEYGMMFSGSAVYDENNTSGLFDTDGAGNLLSGQGIVAILTQPLESAGGQRQILAYSKDGGRSFDLYGEILSAREDGGLGDGEFRDPKVSWNAELGKWLMVVGGGSVRMYASENLLDWDYLGETGYWGECPDLSAYTLESGETKYALVISPEDKENSHIYNGTTRDTAYYPAEYYVVGSLDESGLFVGETQIARLSEGIDSYAFQSFNNAPDGKVYGVSWSGSWETVEEYAGFREAYNGGMTVVCEMNLVADGNGYRLTRTPVDGYAALRSEELFSAQSLRLEAGEDALSGVRATVADLELTLDFSAGDATEATLLLRSSTDERIRLSYSAETQTLTLDRSSSSLLAAETSLYRTTYSAAAPLRDGKLDLRILCDRAFVSVFANGGTASFFSAVFPAATSDGMSLTADGAIVVTGTVHRMNGIFSATENGDLLVSAKKIDTTVGSEETILVSSYATGFDPSRVSFAVAEGAELISLRSDGARATLTALAAGYAKVRISYGTQETETELYLYDNGFTSDLDYTLNRRGFFYVGNDGLHFATGEKDAFRFSETIAEDFRYSARLVRKAGAQAAALVFGVSDNLTEFWVVTADWKEGKVKLWKSGVGDLAVARYYFASDATELSVTVLNGTARVCLNGSDTEILSCPLADYRGGGLGLNVYNGETVFSDVSFAALSETAGGLALGDVEIAGIVNVTDGNAILSAADYTFRDGVLALTDEYLRTLVGKTTYTIQVITSAGTFYWDVQTKFASVSVSAEKTETYGDEEILFTLGRDTTVTRVLFGDRETAFTQSDRTVRVSADELKELPTGTYFVTFYTENGRAETRVAVLEKDLTDVNLSKTVSIVSICAVVGVLLIGAGTYLIVMKKSGRKE